MKKLIEKAKRIDIVHKETKHRFVRDKKSDEILFDDTMSKSRLPLKFKPKNVLQAVRFYSEVKDIVSIEFTFDNRK